MFWKFIFSIYPIYSHLTYDSIPLSSPLNPWPPKPVTERCSPAIADDSRPQSTNAAKSRKFISGKSSKSPTTAYPDTMNITGIALDFVNGNIEESLTKNRPPHQRL